MSGFYNYWPKVNHPNVIFPQMKSEGFKPPFYFGGSQVPINICNVSKEIPIKTRTEVKTIRKKKINTNEINQIT